MTTNDLQWYGAMVGAEQTFSDQGIIAMLCPELAGKTLAELTATEFAQVMTMAKSFSLGSIPEEDED